MLSVHSNLVLFIGVYRQRLFYLFLPSMTPLHEPGVIRRIEVVVSVVQSKGNGTWLAARVVAKSMEVHSSHRKPNCATSFPFLVTTIVWGVVD